MELKLTSLDVLEERVNRGAQTLDLVRPDWAEEIHHEIEIACPAHSVTGQLFGPELEDQMSAVGVYYNSDVPWEHCDRFAEQGFCVITADFVEVPPGIRDRITALVSELSVAVGRDLSEVMSIPPAIPVPRDLDMVTQEAYTLAMLWEKAIKSRR